MAEDVYTVEGSAFDGAAEISIHKNFLTLEKADAFAKKMAGIYKGFSFYVRHGDFVWGLTDFHWKYDRYFKQAIKFCHND